MDKIMYLLAGGIIGAFLVVLVWAICASMKPDSQVRCQKSACTNNWKGLCLNKKQTLVIVCDELSNEYLECKDFNTPDDYIFIPIKEDYL
jgi:hypothetical protein